MYHVIYIPCDAVNMSSAEIDDYFPKHRIVEIIIHSYVGEPLWSFSILVHSLIIYASPKMLMDQTFLAHQVRIHHR